jgi:hypothetical protein
MHPVAAKGVLLLFASTLAVCLFACPPCEGMADTRRPDLIRRHKEITLQEKLRYVRFATVLLAAGLLAAVAAAVLS